MDANRMSPKLLYESSLMKLKSSRRRLCIECFIPNEYSLLIFDRKDGSNFHKILVDGFHYLTHYVDYEPTIYFLEKSDGSRFRDMYMYKLPEDDSKIPKVLDKAKVTTAPPLGSSKRNPAAIGYGQHIIIFSTRLTFRVGSNCPHTDFEMYDPKGKNTVSLPQLCITPCSRDEYELVDPISESSVPFKMTGYSYRYPYARLAGYSIEAICLFETHTLVVRTDLGQSFSLLLSSQNAKWELFSDADGILPHESRFYVANGFCVDTYGAYRMESVAMEMKMLVPPTVVTECADVEEAPEFEDIIVEDVVTPTVETVIDRCRLPFGRRVDFFKSSALTFCDDGVACDVQVGTDEEDRNSYLSVRLLEFNFSKFPGLDFSGNMEEEKNEWAKIIKSYNIPLDVPYVPREFGAYPLHVSEVFSI